MTDAEPLQIDRVGDHGELVVLTLDRPDVHNAIDNTLLARLQEAVHAADGTDGIRGLVITGAGGRAFSTGMDLKERAGFTDDQLWAQRRRIVALILRLHELAIPTVAAVEGFALGGGFELALACDMIVASSEATFGLPEVGVGIFPGGGATQTLTWLVGPARSRDVILTGRRLSAPEAESWGIVSRLVEPGGARAAAIDLVRTIAQGAPLGIRQAKAAIRSAHRTLSQGLDAENGLYDVVLRSEDRVEGFRAFVEKRKPEFKGR